MDIEEVLDDFPTIKTVDYLNAASIGLVPKPVIEKSKDIEIELAKGGTLALDEEKETLIYDGLREEGTKLFGCNAEDIAIFNSTTEALNSFAWSLELKDGKVISTGVEFPSVTYPWLRISRKENVKVKLIKAENWRIPIDLVLNEIDENTRVVVLSHVEYLTGQKFNNNDIKKIAKQIHEVGGILIVDGIQAAGYLPINVKELDVDIYIAGSYKWLLAPFGTAIAYVSKNLYDKVEPALVGWRSREDMWDFDALELSYASTARKFEYSSSAYSVKLGLAESIKYLRNVGIKNIYNHNKKLVDILAEELSSIASVDIITPEDRCSILTLKPTHKDSRPIADALRKLERPVEFSLRLGMIRIAPHIYNNELDVLYFVGNLKQFLR
ncbi:MAG: aminotransferase class V-fold PLP-dependent enzyme [Promethearchaeota archaeon]